MKKIRVNKEVCERCFLRAGLPKEYFEESWDSGNLLCVYDDSVLRIGKVYTEPRFVGSFLGKQCPYLLEHLVLREEEGV